MSHQLMDYAKLRWYAGAIEQEALQIFAGYAGGPVLGQAFTILDRAYRDLYDLARSAGDPLACPWATCSDGTCRPSCPAPKTTPTS